VQPLHDGDVKKVYSTDHVQEGNSFSLLTLAI